MPDNPLAEKVVALRKWVGGSANRQAVTDLAIDVARLEVECQKFRQCAEDLAMAAEFIESLAPGQPDDEKLRLHGAYVPLALADLRRARELLRRETGHA